MPTVLKIRGYKFYFWSNEGREDAHVHVTKGGGNAKFWLEPVISKEYSYRFTIREQRDIRAIIESNYSLLIEKWYAYFK